MKKWLVIICCLLQIPCRGNEPGQHWAYRPVTKPALPPVRNASWSRTSIDRFVLAGLEAKGLQAVKDADRSTVVRRLYFDLHGLPPSAEEMARFEGRKMEALVDALLTSPRFGERWGRHWLDLARFGESVTLRGFIYKEAWRYRDYVIDAFNRDLPYDRFVREQIAGDLLPSLSIEERQRALIATTFLALGNTNFEEQDKKQLEMDVVDEQLDSIGKAILAQTIGCARCHDHKFDPIPTRDYYAMAGILKNARLLEHANVSKWIEIPLPLEPEAETVYAEHEAQVASLESALKQAQEKSKLLKRGDSKATNDAVQPSVIAPREVAGIVVDSAQAKAVGEWKHSQFSKHYIGDGYLHDLNQGTGAKTLTFMPELPRAGRYEVRFAYTPGPTRAVSVPVTVFHADGETPVEVNQRETPAIDGRFVSLGQFRFEANNFSYVLVSTEGADGYVIADAVQFLPAEAVAETQQPAKSTEPIAAEIKRLERQLKEARERGPKRPMVMSVMEEKQITDLQVHLRGSVHRLGELAPRGFLSAASAGEVPPIRKEQSGRRELADWLVSPRNPLAARVFVNRAWHWLFGAGLVRTTDNFGTTGEMPSHPELLDYLADSFVRSGWSIKSLVREIVLSRTYQLASLQSDPSLARNAQIDPENRLLWRANRRRLEAECIRDAMLSVSGRLDLRGGGPTIPGSLASDYGFHYKDFRRSVYVPVLRNAMPELFELFDFADPSVTTGERTVSTVAPQALYLMNHPFVMEQARFAAERTLNSPRTGSPSPAGSEIMADINFAYRTTLGRSPTADEFRIAGKHLAQPGLPDEEKWAALYHALFASVAFRYLE